MERWTLCPTCEGRGSHVNPAVDGNGITAEEMDELGDDFLEDYLGGVYDVVCERCGGLRVVPACRCGEPVAEGVYIVEGGNQRPYSACFEHLEGDERDFYVELAETEAMYAAERRMEA